MKDHISTIRRGAFIQGVLVSLVAVFIFNNWLNESRRSTFGLMFSSFENEIQSVTVNFEDCQIIFNSPKFEKVGNNKDALIFIIPDDSGIFDLEVSSKNGELFKLKGIEYKANKFNYITQHLTSINYVKAHWQ